MHHLSFYSSSYPLMNKINIKLLGYNCSRDAITMECLKYKAYKRMSCRWSVLLGLKKAERQECLASSFKLQL